MQKLSIWVVPPATTIELNSVLRKSTSVFMIVEWTISWTPGYSRPIKSGLKRISGA